MVRVASGRPSSGRLLPIIVALSVSVVLVVSIVLWYQSAAAGRSRIVLLPGGNSTRTHILSEGDPSTSAKQRQGQQQEQQQQQQQQQQQEQRRSPPLGSSVGGFGVPGYTVLGRVDQDKAAWPGGGFVEVEVKHRIASADAQYVSLPGSCFDIAQKVEQPYTGLYQRRRAPPQDLPGGAPRTFYRWEGNITRAEFDAVPRQLPRGPDCVHCGPAIRYQVHDKHLYRQGHPPNWLVEVGEDLLLAALHLFDLPDTDFIIHYDDSCPPGVPVLSWNICRDKPRGGFTYPSYTAWTFALGPEQLKVYHQCLINRYPVPSRRPVVFWRGGTTDPYRPDFKIRNVDKVARMVIHKRYAEDSVVDAKVSKLIFGDECVKQYLEPLAPLAQLEDYNAAAIIMDVDGNGWSDRLSRVVHFPSPTFKQASNHTAFFEHLLAPGRAAEYYANDLSDLTARAYNLVGEWNTSSARLMALATQKQGIGLAFLNQVAVAEAAAYSILQYGKRVTWPFVHDKSYEHVPFTKACRSNGAKLPAQLCDEMKARPAHRVPP